MALFVCFVLIMKGNVLENLIALTSKICTSFGLNILFYVIFKIVITV